MTEAELLLRMAATLKQDIGPAVGAEYPKTQAFMAGVVLQKIAAQLALAPAHAQAEADEMDSLVADLNATYTMGRTQQAITRLAQERDQETLCALIETLYVTRDEIGDGQFFQLIDRIHQSLRASLDRRLEYSE